MLPWDVRRSSCEQCFACFLTLPPVLWLQQFFEMFWNDDAVKAELLINICFLFSFWFSSFVFMSDGCPRAESRPVAEGRQILSQSRLCARENQLELSTSVWHALLVHFLISDTYLNWWKKSFLATSNLNVSKSWNFTTRLFPRPTNIGISFILGLRFGIQWVKLGGKRPGKALSSTKLHAPPPMHRVEQWLSLKAGTEPKSEIHHRTEPNAALHSGPEKRKVTVDEISTNL